MVFISDHLIHPILKYTYMSVYVHICFMAWFYAKSHLGEILGTLWVVWTFHFFFSNKVYGLFIRSLQVWTHSVIHYCMNFLRDYIMQLDPLLVTFLLGLEIMYYPNITSYITHSSNSLQYTHFLPFFALPESFKYHLQTIVMRLAHKTAHRN